MMKSKRSIIDKAVTIASIAHLRQKRKADGTPYIAHPMRVAMALARYGFSEETIAAGCTHDVLEDTDYSLEQLRRELGAKVAKIVQAVTNDNTLAWEDKKLRYIQTTKDGPEEAKAVACADKIDNMLSLIEAYQIQGIDVWKKFNHGRDGLIWYWSELLKMFKKRWKHPLLAEYESILREIVRLS